MKTHKQLLNNIIGQLNGIIKMMEAEEDCFEILIQFKAVKSALNSITGKFLQENLKKCLKNCKGDTDKMCDKFISEIILNN